ncbi:tRNA pseudouridine(55) synthase TruB [Leucobacter weissii]|uniref:tRNA pseudouridine synthase B n=1 Tax=Leucobacter weissii TaxID=1983706 RepID=A0A939S6E9_9MICO|nr:tRNA pseudouridine(55) synthase TruB [Leucobacter weissii]MBO1902304.1 tRNA pseudouridine(55) synthase TruB [Leucobacter weissii]
MGERTPNGILLVDKAEGWTSHDVVAKARRAVGTRKVGHAGTLDPMATGLLVLGVGPSTRLLTHLVGLDKSYTATIRLGAATVTDDREGETVARAPGERIERLLADPAALTRAADLLTGPIEQVPSAVSAIKVDGRRAYDRVRAGEQVELKSRRVTIHRFALGEPRAVRSGSGAPGATAIDVDAEVSCSSGTYVRALARDLGRALDVGGHLTALRRTGVGPFAVDGALGTDALASGGSPQLMPPADAARALFPVLRLGAAQAEDLGHGKRLEVDPLLVPDAGLAAAIGPDGRLIGLASIAGGRVRVVTNFPAEPPAHRSGPAARETAP